MKLNRNAIAVNDDMSVMFDEGQEPSDVRLYAIGDVNGRCMLAHAATMQGKVVLGLRELTDVIPSAVFTVPECAMVGLTEEKCPELGRDIKSRKSDIQSQRKSIGNG